MALFNSALHLMWAVFHLSRKLAGLPGIPFNPFVIYSCRLAVQDAPLMTSLYEANLRSATHLMRWGSGTDTPLFFRFLLET